MNVKGIRNCRKMYKSKGRNRSDEEKKTNTM